MWFSYILLKATSWLDRLFLSLHKILLCGCCVDKISMFAEYTYIAVANRGDMVKHLLYLLNLFCIGSVSMLIFFIDYSNGV